MNTSPGFVADFREAAPYIHYLRGKTLVIGITDSLLEGDTLRDAKQAVGMIRSDIEAALCSSASAPLRNKPIPTASGNFLTARPLGVIDGIDMGYTGIVRKTDTDSINRRLDDGAIVLISPLGHSYGGKTFNLSMSEAAEAVAVALQAEKLVYLTEEAGICNADGVLMSTLSSGEVCHLIETANNVPVRLLQAAVNAVENGVSRVQILSGREDGGLLRELFTREGCGTAIARDSFVSIRQAHSRDIPRIIALIRPLEEQGILLHRSREYLENHISCFSVLEHDRNIYGCVALKTFDDPEIGELACLVVSPEARDGGYGEMLLDHLFQKARAMGIRRLFALSTHTGEWFAERGFQTTSPDALPEERRRDYLANGRNSQVFVRELA